MASALAVEADLVYYTHCLLFTYDKLTSRTYKVKFDLDPLAKEKVHCSNDRLVEKERERLHFRASD